MWKDILEKAIRWFPLIQILDELFAGDVEAATKKVREWEASEFDRIEAKLRKKQNAGQ